MSEWTAELAFKELCKNENLIKAAIDQNEATTRLRAIDTILYAVLGWDKVYVEAEKYCRETGYADYAFMSGDSLVMILEAKKQGKSFLLPDREFPNEPCPFGLLASESKNADEALRQAISYSVNLGARFSAITNGHQWILAQTFRQGVRLEERSVFVFESFEAIKNKKFRMFFDIFCPKSIYGNLPENYLLESRKQPAPPKLSSQIESYPRPTNRNVIANELDVATHAIWSEIQNNEQDLEFLTECYVEPRTSSAAAKLATELLHQRASANEARWIQPLATSDLSEEFINEMPEKPVVILGPVGRGKTTFLRYFRQIKAKRFFSNYIQLDIDFLDRPDNHSEVGDYIYDNIAKQLSEKYQVNINANNMVRGFLHNELLDFKGSYEGQQYPEESDNYKELERDHILNIRKDKHEYLRRVFIHFQKGENKTVAVFLDNLDRRSDDIQEEAFLKASAIARDWSAIVFVCLRPSTFYRSKRFGVLDSVEPKVISVNAPNTGRLVNKRLLYAKKIADGDTLNGSKANRFTKYTSYDLPTTSVFLSSCARSFIENQNLSDLFESVSNGNAREVLTNVILVLTSQHLNTNKILKILEKQSTYNLAPHEALRALIYRDSEDYDPTNTVFLNLFDLTRAEPIEHFSKIALLEYLARIPTGAPNFGFDKTGSVRSYMCSLGFSLDHVKTITELLFVNQYIEARKPHEDWSDDIDMVRVTQRGIYSARHLVKEFTYLDAIIIDTPILDSAVRKQIKDVKSIQERLARAKLFLDYMDTCILKLQDQPFQSHWSTISEVLRSSIEQIKSSLKN